MSIEIFEKRFNELRSKLDLSKNNLTLIHKLLIEISEHSKDALIQEESTKGAEKLRSTILYLYGYDVAEKTLQPRLPQ